VAINFINGMNIMMDSVGAKRKLRNIQRGTWERSKLKQNLLKKAVATNFISELNVLMYIMCVQKNGERFNGGTLESRTKLAEICPDNIFYSWIELSEV
jgi:hypothetical protein